MISIYHWRHTRSFGLAWGGLLGAVTFQLGRFNEDFERFSNLRLGKPAPECHHLESLESKIEDVGFMDPQDTWCNGDVLRTWGSFERFSVHEAGLFRAGRPKFLAIGSPHVWFCEEG